MAFSSRVSKPRAAEPERALLIAIDGAQGQALDSTQLRRLVTEHVDVVWRSLRRFGVRPADVDDATQRVFMIVNEKLAKIEQGRERAFLIGIAARVASHARRAYQRHDQAEMHLSAGLDAANPNPEELTQQLEARALLDRVLDRMPEELRAVFVLFELEELSVDEIARCLGLPRGTVATRLRRSRDLFHQRANLLAAQNGKGLDHG